MLNSQSSIWKKSFFVFLSQLIRLITNLFLFIGIARLYGIDLFGQFSFTYTIATICIVLADFGFDVLLTAEIAKSRNNAVKVGQKYFSLKLVFGFISSIIMISIASFQDISYNSRLLIFLLIPFVYFTTFSNFYYAIFRGLEKFEYETQISFVSNSLLICVILFAGILQITLFYTVFLFVITRFINVIYGTIKLTTLLGKNILKVDFSDWRKTINNVLIYGFHFIFGNLFFQLDIILLGFLKGDYDVGLYKSAFNVMMIVLLIPEIAISTLLPTLSKLYFEDYAKWISISKLLFKVLLFIAIPLFFIIYFNADFIIKTIFGSMFFDEAIPILKIFSFVIFIRYIVEPFALMLTTSQNQHIRLIIVIIATLLSLNLNYYVIPLWGIKGAAIVCLVVNLLVGAGYIIKNTSLLYSWLLNTRIITVFIIAIIMGVMYTLFLYDIVILFLFLLLYAFATILIGFSVEERQIIFPNILTKR